MSKIEEMRELHQRVQNELGLDDADTQRVLEYLAQRQRNLCREWVARTPQEIGMARYHVNPFPLADLVDDYITYSLARRGELQDGQESKSPHVIPATLV